MRIAAFQRGSVFVSWFVSWFVRFHGEPGASRIDVPFSFMSRLMVNRCRVQVQRRASGGFNPRI